MKEISVKADKEVINEVFDFVEGELGQIEGCTRKDIMRIHMVVDELFANVANYAYGDGDGDVKVGFEFDSDTAVISFTDSGKPYNPLEQEEPDVTLSARERRIGGLGVFLVKNTVDDIRYENRDGKNIVKIYKKVGG